MHHGQRVMVVDESGARVEAEVSLRDAVPRGSAFLERGIERDGANALRGATVALEAITELLVARGADEVEEALA